VNYSFKTNEEFDLPSFINLWQYYNKDLHYDSWRVKGLLVKQLLTAEHNCSSAKIWL